MIQFNLLPDVKLEFVRAQRVKNTVISASLIATASAFTIFLLLFLTVNVVQKKNINDMTRDIKKYHAQLKSIPDIDKILTIQSQLGALPDLHAGKPAASRTFRYIEQITPSDVMLTDFTSDYATNIITITGQAASLDRVNTFVDTLKYTKYTAVDDTGKKGDEQKAFTGVVLSQFTRSAASTTFTISSNYAPDLFDNANWSVLLNIPSGVSTSSVVGQPTTIFKKAAN